MTTCAYTDYLSGGSGGDEVGSPGDSMAEDSFSDSETSSTAADCQNSSPTSGPLSLDYLADFLGSGNHNHKGYKSKNSRKPCKYVPHSDKPVHVVEKRNARERRRVEAVNLAFVRLRKVVPHENRRKRISKVKTLRVAMDYIGYLQDMIDEYDRSQRLQAMADMHHLHQHQQQQQQQHHHQQHPHPQQHHQHPMGAVFVGASPPPPPPHPAYITPDAHSPGGWAPALPPPHHHHHHHLQGAHHPHQHPIQGLAEEAGRASGGEGPERYDHGPCPGPPTPCTVPHSLYYPQETVSSSYARGTPPGQCGGSSDAGWSAPKLYCFDQS